MARPPGRHEGAGAVISWHIAQGIVAMALLFLLPGKHAGPPPFLPVPLTPVLLHQISTKPGLAHHCCLYLLSIAASFLSLKVRKASVSVQLRASEGLCPSAWASHPVTALLFWPTPRGSSLGSTPPGESLRFIWLISLSTRGITSDHAWPVRFTVMDQGPRYKPDLSGQTWDE